LWINKVLLQGQDMADLVGYAVVVWAIVGGCIGYGVGRLNGRMGPAVALCILLGPAGVIAALLLPRTAACEAEHRLEVDRWATALGQPGEAKFTDLAQRIAHESDALRARRRELEIYVSIRGEGRPEETVRQDDADFRRWRRSASD
jgi:hypothetical protein